MFSAQISPDSLSTLCSHYAEISNVTCFHLQLLMSAACSNIVSSWDPQPKTEAFMWVTRETPYFLHFKQAGSWVGATQHNYTCSFSPLDWSKCTTALLQTEPTLRWNWNQSSLTLELLLHRLQVCVSPCWRFTLISCQVRQCAGVKPAPRSVDISSQWASTLMRVIAMGDKHRRCRKGERSEPCFLSVAAC